MDRAISLELLVCRRKQVTVREMPLAPCSSINVNRACRSVAYLHAGTDLRLLISYGETGRYA